MAVISVIVPIYMTEPYIRRCIDSILRQTFQDFDLILVNDGSPDNCANICYEYARKDSRIHVVQKRNEGLSAARNAGIGWAYACSDSQWLTFIDSDDWVHPEMLERLLKAAVEQNTNISICGFVETEGFTPLVPRKLFRTEIWDPELFYIKHCANATAAWGKLYSKSCFSLIRYPYGKIHEDEYVTYKLLFSQKYLAVIPAPMYAYFINPKGITRKKWSDKRLDIWGAYEEQIAFFGKLGKKELVRDRYHTYLENALTSLEAAEQREIIRKIKKKIKNIILRAWERGYIDFRQQYDLLYRFFPVRTKLYGLYLNSTHANHGVEKVEEEIKNK